MLRHELQEALSVTYTEVSQLVTSSPGCCEAAVLQLLLDAMFLSTWLGAGKSSARASDYGMFVFRGAVDPINYRLCAPAMLENCQAFYAGSGLYLSILTSAASAQWGSGAEAAAAPVATEGGASTPNTVGLAPSMRRFALLPLPLDISAATEGGADMPSTTEMDAAADEEGSNAAEGASSLGFGFGNIRLKW